MTNRIITPLLLNTIELRNDGFDFAHISARADMSIMVQALSELRYLAYNYGSDNRVAYISMPHPSGLVSFKFHDPDNEHGFGGGVFEIAMYDGPVIKIKGPWSGSCGLVNQITGRRVTEVSINGLATAIDSKVLQPQLHAVDERWTLTEDRSRHGFIDLNVSSQYAERKPYAPTDVAI